MVYFHFIITFPTSMRCSYSCFKKAISSDARRGETFSTGGKDDDDDDDDELLTEFDADNFEIS